MNNEVGLPDPNPVRVVFVPSHLTLGLLAGAISLVTGLYAFYEFSQVELEEVVAMVSPPK
jgi:hypothetical protein